MVGECGGGGAGGRDARGVGGGAYPQKGVTRSERNRERGDVGLILCQRREV